MLVAVLGLLDGIVFGYCVWFSCFCCLGVVVASLGLMLVDRCFRCGGCLLPGWFWAVSFSVLLFGCADILGG